jgi:hypothetical protein
VGLLIDGTARESVKTLIRRALWIVPRSMLFCLLYFLVSFTILFVALFFLVIACRCDPEPIINAVRGDGSISALLFILSLTTSFAAWRLGRRYLARRADRALREISKPPTLYLRQFRSDQADFARVWSIGKLFLELAFNALPFFGFPLPRRLRYKRLEEIASEEIDPSAAFVAIGDPKERLPELGAARAYRSKDDWRKRSSTGWIKRD